LIAYTREAEDQVADLIRHYEGLRRTEAIRAFLDALTEAERRINDDPESGLPAPRPYPGLAELQLSWLKAGRYWIAYSRQALPVIVAVFFRNR
jgi:plasmid stabilization system protein ParE